MPPDKQNGKPFTPALSSNFRSTKSPLTPKLAGAGHNSHATAKRTAFVRQPSPGKEDVPSLDGNITPRSAARKSRTESPSNTPTATRTAAAPRSVGPNVNGSGKSTPSQQGLGIHSPLVQATPTPLGNVHNPTNSPTPIYTVPRRVSGARSTVKADEQDDAKFFRAGDAKSYHISAHEKPPAESNGHFFYVGSPPETLTSPRLLSSKPHHSPTGSNVDEKFFHAREARPNIQRSGARSEVQPRSTPASSVAARSPQLGSKPGRPITRSRSPAKGPQLARPTSKGNDVRGKPLAVATPLDDKRRGSLGSNASNVKDPQLSHRKSMSANSVTSTPTRKLSAPRPISIPTLEERLGLGAASTALDSLLIPTASPDSTSPRSVSLGSGPSDVAALSDPMLNAPQSSAPDPTGALPPTSPPLPPSNNPPDPAAQARRERKVLDLEISNSSLLAINKTLERELRKQNVELRRFRRLSRSGRLSFAPSGRNVSNSTLGTLPELDDVSEHSLSDSEDEELDEEDLDAFSNESSSGVTSPTTRARQRARDEKRLIMDLTKHQQMLLDSQKLSQSIKRCLTCTDELIRDGTKALEYRVNIGDVRIGGRVLTNDETEVNNDEGDEARKGLLSPGVEIGDWLQGGLWVSQNPLSRDSAILEDTTGSPSQNQSPSHDTGQSQSMPALDELDRLLQEQDPESL
ncbi:uncharacterized protein HMPREF1541_06268 [Cyphellophora europaea CBS 101466]|uniref:Uncharacterized protein n=1 Tax=Cyphellophora europaea (strain CBS 101466) TaxID=1220924 RepID=W2RP36_CYPE1|nr:uncharacterized protein HMPREF1541_06268 [Cyphellophora europaea CBS 101466]ETN38237.1 hypothetical protein HMPREF1541_06268 [Cyphellophora europaea CBS 101466]